MVLDDSNENGGILSNSFSFSYSINTSVTADKDGLLGNVIIEEALSDHPVIIYDYLQQL